MLYRRCRSKLNDCLTVSLKLRREHTGFAFFDALGCRRDAKDLRNPVGSVCTYRGISTDTVLDSAFSGVIDRDTTIVRQLLESCVTNTRVSFLDAQGCRRDAKDLRTPVGSVCTYRGISLDTVLDSDFTGVIDRDTTIV